MFGIKRADKTTVIKVDGMSCEHCKMRVKKALEAVKGVRLADVDLENKQVTVHITKDVDIQALKDAIEIAGYKAS